MCIQTVRGEFLGRVSIGGGKELALFRNDERDFKVFEIEILKGGHIFTLQEHCCDEKTALKKYAEILLMMVADI